MRNKFSYNELSTYPAVKLLLPLVLGIWFQNIFSFSNNLLFCLAGFFLVAYFIFNLFSNSIKFSFYFIKSFIIFGISFSIGSLVLFMFKAENNPKSIINNYEQNSPILVTITDNIVAKEKSYKAEAKIEYIKTGDNWKQVNGNIFLYFKKDSTPPNLALGSCLLLNKNVYPIINSGNPGGFDYSTFCSYKNVYHQAFLKESDYKLIGKKKLNKFNSSIIKAREWILQIIRINIKSKDEQSIAEALLIGYREDLDRDLVKAYSNTGVVHIIAISGLHLGMIYQLILLLFARFKQSSRIKYYKLFSIIFILWGFTCIAGMAPSILRSAVMFTVIAFGDCFNKKNNIYNNLAVSAIIILAFNPYSFWDIGFLLSYSAVLSIVIFSPYIKKWFYFKNKYLNAFWNLNAITISAQILTLPIILLKFHQFPVLFLITNIIAVPLSGVILYLELFLILISFCKPIASFVGHVIELLLTFLNKAILFFSETPYTVLKNLQISYVQSFFVFFTVLFFGYWLIKKQAKFFTAFLVALGSFLILRSIDFIDKNQQKKIVVYNVPNHKAIDIIEGRNMMFIGDSILTKDGFLQNFHIKPSRILHRIKDTTPSFKNIKISNNFVYSNKTILAVIDQPFLPLNEKVNVDVVIVSKNPKLYISELLKSYNTKRIVFDGSNPTWKVDKWKKDCDSLSIPYHICAIDGAFSINL